MWDYSGLNTEFVLSKKTENAGLYKNNNFVIPLKYGSSSGEFFEGIACVEVNEKSETYYKYIFTNDKDAF